MTVLYFADTRFPIERANGAQTMATCHALAARGHHVTLVVRPDSADVARDPFAFYGVGRIPQLVVRTVPRSAHTASSRARYLLSAIWMMHRHPDAVVYTRDLGLASFVLRMSAAKLPRVVYESHGIAPVVASEMAELLGAAHVAPTAAKLARLDARERRVWQGARAYVTITRGLAQDLAARYGPRERVFVAPDGANAPSPEVTTSPAATEDQAPVVGYAGHLYPWKGVDVLVRALTFLPGMRALIVGGHPGESDLARIETLARDLGVRDRVTITGLIPPQEVAARLAPATILALPNIPSTISERYTSPLKLFEYLWLSRPIVASDSASVREVLTDEVNALLVAPGEAAPLARACQRLSSDQRLAAALGAAARQLAPNFTWAARASTLEVALYSAVRA